MTAGMRMIDETEVRRRLSYERCIPIVRDAMIALSAGTTRQMLRSVIPLADGRMFGIMGGALGEEAVFGSKLVSVFPQNFALGRPSHQGVVMLFDPASGAPVCVADAGAITAIRTAAASAVATDALARGDARSLAILGYGEQAATHIRAIAHVRALDDVRVWGRDPALAARFAAAMAAELALPVRAAPSAQAAVEHADIVCTVTNAAEPILLGRWLAPGVHVNLVGSSVPGRVEVDDDLVADARYIADSRAGVLEQGAEFLHAIETGRIGVDHLVGEIGEVLAGGIAGRQHDAQRTAYKSLGHIVQDLAATQALFADES